MKTSTVSIHVIAENCFIKVIREPIGIGYKMFMKLRKLNELSHVRKSMQNGNEFLNDFSLILINDFSLKLMNFDVVFVCSETKSQCEVLRNDAGKESIEQLRTVHKDHEATMADMKTKIRV